MERDGTKGWMIKEAQKQDKTQKGGGKVEKWLGFTRMNAFTKNQSTKQSTINASPNIYGHR